MMSAHSSGRRKRPRVAEDERKRTSKACSECRRRKLKCDGKDPCQRCVKQQAVCTFEYAETDQFEQWHHPVHDERCYLMSSILAKLHPEVPQTLSGLENYLAELKAQEIRQPSVDASTGCTLLTPGPIYPSPAIEHSTSRTGMVPLWKEASSPSALITVQAHGKAHFDGESSHNVFYDAVSEAVIGDKSDGEHHHRRKHEHSPVPPDRTHVEEILGTLPPKDVVNFLVATFFKYPQSNYYYVHHAKFHTKLGEFLETPQSGLASSDWTEFACLLLMMMACASIYADLEAEISGNDMSTLHVSNNSIPLADPDVPHQDVIPGLEFYQISKRHLPQIISRNSVTSVQIVTLMGQFLLGANSRDESYSMFGLSLRMAINMGMHRSLNTGTLQAQDQELRNRLWWTVYVLERHFAVALGRPLSIDESEIDTALPTFLPSLDSNGSKFTFKNQIVSINLCRIMGAIVGTVYGRSQTTEGQIIDPAQIRELMHRLVAWSKNLPEELKITEFCSRAVIHLHLAHQQTIILLTRKFLNHSVAKKRSPGSHLSQKFVKECTQICIDAAKTTMNLMGSLRDRSLLTKFSFYDSLYCSGALYVLLLGAKLEPMNQGTMQTLTDGLSILQYLARGNEAAATSLRQICRGFRLCLTSQQSGTGTDPHIQQSERSRGHKAWQNWSSAKYQAPFDGGDTVSHSGVRLDGNSDCASTWPPHINYDDSSYIAALDSNERVLPFWLPNLEENQILSRDFTNAPSLDFFNFMSIGGENDCFNESVFR